ncbi:MAG: leucine-rich repeat domain-containing protein [Clostridia bacterium]|nr:leucine-rich repeat domain-containing protein [Clostridia bacterium]
MKRNILLLLTLLLALALSCALADYTCGDFKYTRLYSGTAEITGYSGDATELVIPPELDGYTVTSISAYSLSSWSTPACQTITSITLPSTIESVNSTLFHDCNQLQEIVVSPLNPTLATIDGVLFNKTDKQLLCFPQAYAAASYAIPQGVRSIAPYAFYLSVNLTDVSIPDSVTEIGDHAFCYCRSLTGAVLPEGVKSLGTGAFGNCTSLKSVSLPCSMMDFPSDAFQNCYALEEFILPHDHPSMFAIDGVLFSHWDMTLLRCPPSAPFLTSRLFFMPGRQHYTIPYGTSRIAEYAFEGCVNLKSVSIPPSVRKIGEGAFYNCHSLKDVDIPHSVVSIGSGAFSSCSSLTDVTLPDSLREISSSMFAYCYDLHDVSIPDSVTVIGSYAFSNCNSLKNIALPDSLTQIDYQAFGDCISLKSIVIPDSVRHIAAEAFLNCDALQSVTIPGGIASIDEYTFAYCDSLTHIALPESISHISDSAFKDCEQLSGVTVVRGSYAAEWAQQQQLLPTITLPEGLSAGDLTYRLQADGTACIIRCSTEAESLEIPASLDGAPVTTISPLAFEHCTSLKSLTIPQSVTAIADNAFEGCGRITFTVVRDSFAALWCEENGRRYTFPDSLDWLLD